MADNMYKYDITINDWHQSLNYVIKKVYTYVNDRTKCYYRAMSR